MDDAHRERFWSRVRKGAGCWIFGNYPKWRYGHFYFDRGHIRASRLSWLLTRGPIPKGLCVCHKCDTPACVKPSHLFLGTHQENVRDMHVKGRAQRSDGAFKNARLRACDVLAIRQSKETQAVLAERYGITGGHVSEIQRGLTWRHIKTGVREKNRHPNATKLNAAQALAIKMSKEPGLVVAAQYGISRPMVYSIRKGRRWKHLG